METFGRCVSERELNIKFNLFVHMLLTFCMTNIADDTNTKTHRKCCSSGSSILAVFTARGKPNRKRERERLGFKQARPKEVIPLDTFAEQSSNA